MTSDIGWIHSSAYEAGKDPIDHAVAHVGLFLEVISQIREGRAVDPSSFRLYGSDISFDHFARRIIGNLLDAGWTPPTVPEVSA